MVQNYFSFFGRLLVLVAIGAGVSACHSTMYKVKEDKLPLLPSNRECADYGKDVTEQVTTLSRECADHGKDVMGQVTTLSKEVSHAEDLYKECLYREQFFPHGKARRHSGIRKRCTSIVDILYYHKKYKEYQNDELACKILLEHLESPLNPNVKISYSCWDWNSYPTLEQGCEYGHRSALGIALYFGDEEVVRFLLNHGAIANCKAKTRNDFLEAAVMAGYPGITALLLDYISDPNILYHGRYGNGKALLHVVIEKNKIDMVKVLLNNDKIDPNILNTRGWTPLYLAVECNNLNAIELLLNNDKIDPNVQDENERITALHLAVSLNKPELIKVLLNSSKVNPNVQDENERITALHLAVRLNKPALVKILLGSSLVDLTIRDAKDRTPLQVAKKHGYTKIVKLLEGCG